MSHEYSRSRSVSSQIPWTWVGIIVAIFAIIIIARSFSSSGNSVDEQRAHLLISPETTASTIFISMTESSKNRLTGTGGQPLYVGDKSVSVETGGARAKNANLSMDLDERTELSYVNTSSTGDTISMSKGRVWIEQTSNTGLIKMKNLSVATKAGDVIIVEQNNQIYSTVYALKGDITISTSVGDHTLKSGNRIMVSASDLANPGLQLVGLTGVIDESITLTPLFIRNNGQNLLLRPTNSLSGNTGAVENTGAISGNSVISITDPADGFLSNKPTISINGKINSKDVKRITFNDKDAVISPVEETFRFADFPITLEINNIVYKVYSSEGKEIQKGVITIFGSKQMIQNNNKLIANNSPISSKDFQIINPDSNPFVTTDRNIKVQGIVPKDKVSYIIVNDYRLQKYIAGSTNWYYFANMDTETLKDGINLYTIKFFGINDELLYTQLFTIIKESKNVTLSGESSR
ncbi:hypothetical protein K2X92_05625 [Candidatus Gracilibacteria bacterium]|nr:hypothetical protein [Candidatus Gracilibacteria bacterium]